MNILFIQPKLNPNKNMGIKGLNLVQAEQFYFLHLSVYHLASITPPEYNIKLIDERFEDLIFSKDYDLVVITCSTPFAPRAYEIADRFKKKDVNVVLGGPHPSLLPKEAITHADSVIIGEVDINWEKLLKDSKEGKLKRFYKNKKEIPLEKIKRYRLDILDKYLLRTEASRGCPNRCKFCLVPILHGDKKRTRPIEDVINEIKQMKKKIINFDDPSLTTNVEYTKNLFKNLVGLNKKFTCCGNVDVLSKDDELLSLAKKAGCIGWFVGFESFNQKTIEEAGKKTNIIKEYSKVADKIHRHGMILIGSFMFGFDTDDKDIFDKTLDAIYKLGLDSVDFNILGVYPGTLLFDKLDKEKRILTKDWSEYNFGQVVFKPKNMTKKELEQGTWRIAKEFFSLKNIIIRCTKSLRYGFYPFIFITYKNLISRKFYYSWKYLYKD